MIPYFPTLYEDELFYSGLCRYYCHTGCVSYHSVIPEIFNNVMDRPDIEFMNSLSSDMMRKVQNHYQPEEIIMRHTMYPYYVRFLPSSRKKEVYHALIDNKGQVRNLLSQVIGKDGNDRFLRYCPLCVMEDRENYGETYWHRKHQIKGVVVCYRHGCLLKDTGIVIKGNSEPSFHPAELVIEICSTYCKKNGESTLPELDDQSGMTINTEEIRLAGYITSLLDQPVDVENKDDAWEFLKTKMIGQGILAGIKQNVIRERLQTFLQNFYRGHSITLPIKYENIIYRAATKRVRDILCICYIAYSLGIPIRELAGCHLEQGTAGDILEKKVYSMVGSGKTYKGTARELGLAKSTVERFCNRAGIKSCKATGRTEAMERQLEERRVREREWWIKFQDTIPECTTGKLRRDIKYQKHIMWLERHDKAWLKEHDKSMNTFRRIKREDRDRQQLPRVESAIKAIKTAPGMPVRASMEEILRNAEIPSYELRRLPMCYEEIRNSVESYPNYWGRKLSFVMDQLEKQGKPLQYSTIYLMTSINREKMEKALPHIQNKNYREVISSFLH